MRARGGATKVRKALRIGAIVLASTLGVATIGVCSAWLYARSGRGQARLAALVVSALRETMPGLHIGRLGPTGKGGALAASDIVVLDAAGAPAIRLRRLEVRPRWRALLGRHLDLESVRLEGLKVDAHPLPASAAGAEPPLNLSTLVRASEKQPSEVAQKPSASPSFAPAPLRGWSVAKLEIADAEATYRASAAAEVVRATFGITANAAGDADRLRLELAHVQAGAVGVAGRGPLSLALTGNATMDTHGGVEAAVTRLQLDGLRPDAEAIVAHAGLHVATTNEGAARTARAEGSVEAGAAGHATFEGQAMLGAQGLGDFRVAAQADDVALAAVSSGAVAGVLGVQVRASGTGTPLQPGSNASLSLELAPSRIAGYEISRAAVDASAEGPRWSLDRLAAQVAGLSVQASAQGEGTAGHARVVLDVTRARSRAAATKKTARRAPPEPAWAGISGRAHLVAEVEGTWPGQLHGRVDGSARTLDLDGKARLGRARVALTASATRAAADAPTWSIVSRGLAQVADVSTEAASIDAASASWNVRDTAGGNVLANGPPIPAGSIDVNVRGVNLRQSRPLAIAALSLSARGNGRQATLSARGEGAAAHGEIAGELRRDARQVALTLSRANLAFSSQPAKTKNGGGAKNAVQHVALTGPTTVTFRPADQEIAVAGLRVRADGPLARGELAADGQLGWPGAVRTRGHGKVTLAVRGATSFGLPAIDADLDAELTASRATGKVHARTHAGSADLRAAVDAPVSMTATGMTLARTGPLTASAESSDIELASFPPLQRLLSRWGLIGGHFNVRASVNGDLADPRGTVALEVERLEYRSVTGDGRDSVIHRVPGIGLSTHVATSANRIQVSSRLALYGGGFATVQAELNAGLVELLRGADPRSAPLSVMVDVPRFQIAAFRSVSDELRDTSGWLSVHGQVAGSLAAPKGSVDVKLDEGHVDQIALGPVSAHAEVDGRTVRGALRVRTSAAGGDLVATGHTTLAGAAPSISATIDARRVDPGFVRPFVDGLRELRGTVDAHLTIEGAWPRPVVNGKVYFYGGRIGLVDEPTFHDVGLAIAVAPGRVDLEKLQVYSGAGSLTGTGHATLGGMRLTSAELTAHAHRFAVAAAGVSGSRLDGDLQIHVSRGDATSLVGTAKVPMATVWLPGLSLDRRPVQRVTPHDDVRFVDGASQAAAARDARKPAEPPTTVVLKGEANTVFVRAKDVDIELTSRLTLQTTGAGEPALKGFIRFRRGRIAIAGQRFDLDDSRIVFDGTVTPHLELKLAHSYPEATVFVEINGTAAHPDLRFRSDPPIYDQSQIVSLVLTGHVAGAPSGPAPDPTAVVANLVLGRLADKLAPQLGLDVLKVEQSTPPPDQTQSPGLLSERVEVGKYVSERVFVSYAHVFGATDTQNSNEAQAEYHVSSDWMAQTVFGDAGVGGVDAFWTHRY